MRNEQPVVKYILNWLINLAIHDATISRWSKRDLRRPILHWVNSKTTRLCAGRRSGRACVAFSGVRDDPFLCTFRQAVVALGNAEHDALRFFSGEFLRQCPRFLSTVSPVCHAMEHGLHRVTLEQRDLSRDPPFVLAFILGLFFGAPSQR